MRITALNIWKDEKHSSQKGESKLVNIIGHKTCNILYSNSHYISFEFVATGYQSSQKKQYAYWLEGYTNKKFYVGNERKATFTNLNPGTYTFHVIAANCDGYWTEQGDSHTFTIIPPWWKTWWFKILSSVIFAFLLLLIYYIRIIRIKQQNKLLESTVEIRTKDLIQANNEIKTQNSIINAKNEELFTTLETKDKLISIIAHDLKNPT
ncbi:MAG: hypothetical protein IPO21_05070 [Bacteroidales bacterium]|nr:hypothetical protein [Bacteroidales bacterium]